MLFGRSLFPMIKSSHLFVVDLCNWSSYAQPSGNSPTMSEHFMKTWTRIWWSKDVNINCLIKGTYVQCHKFLLLSTLTTGWVTHCQMETRRWRQNSVWRPGCYRRRWLTDISCRTVTIVSIIVLYNLSSYSSGENCHWTLTFIVSCVHSHRLFCI